MRRKIKSEKIETIRKRFHNRREWLVIAVDELDKSTTTPLTGRVIAHGPDREEISKKYIAHKGLSMIEYSGPFPKEPIYIFRAHA